MPTLSDKYWVYKALEVYTVFHTKALEVYTEFRAEMDARLCLTADTHCLRHQVFFQKK